MKKKTKSNLYSHIASSIIPTVSLVAVPSVASQIPQQKTRANEQWGPLASTLVRASSVDQLLIPSATHLHSQQNVVHRRSIGRMDASTDEDNSDEEEERKHREKSNNSTRRNNKSRSASLSDIEKRLFSQKNDDEESTSTMNAAGANSIYHFDSKQDISQSSDLNAAPPKRTSVSIKSNNISSIVNNPLLGHASPTTPRAVNRTVDDEGKSGGAVYSLINDSVTRPISARSVSFKETIPESDESSSSKVSAPISKSNPISNYQDTEYEQKIKHLENHNQFLNDEVQQVRLNNRNLQKQQEELLDRLQTSQKLSKQELADLFKQTEHEQTKNLEDLTRTLQNRCDQLQHELTVLQERHTESEYQSTIRDLKKKNHDLETYVQRLNSALNSYQIKYPSKTFQQIEKEERKFQGLPMKGPTPIWLLNQKFLAPLFVYYDEKLQAKTEFVQKLQSQLINIDEQMKLLANENTRLHDRLSRSPASQGNDNHLSDIEQIKRQAYLVLEENKVLQDQLDLQTNRLNDVQKNQIQEVSTLTRRLLIIESEKTEADRILDTIKMKNDDLKRKYEQLLLDNTHRIHVQEHIHEINEMKRLTDELSEKHANEMQILLRRVQDAESGKKISQLKLTEYRTEIERLKGEILALKKLAKKLQLRVQTYENKLQLEQIKETKLTNIIEKTTDEFEQIKIERDTYLALAKVKEEELNKTQTKFADETEKLNLFEERLENYKNKTKERITTATEDLQKQHDLLKLRCLEYEQQIQQLRSLLNDKQILVNDLYAEKRHLEVDLETVWQATTADNLRMREQIADLRISS